MKKDKITKKQILEHVFSIIAPGKPLRAAIERIQEANLGAIIVLGDPKSLADVMRGGFELNTHYTPQKVYELSKMDGAIIVSENIKTIYGANIQLQPDVNIKTDESGTRHQAAHRIAKQKGNLVIAVSERRNRITIYKGDFTYSLNDLSNLLVKASQAITALEKYSTGIEKGWANLSLLEFDNVVTLYDVVEVIRMYGLLFKMSEELNEYMAELGTESRLVKLQYEEIMLWKEESFINFIKDYKIDKEKAEKVEENLRNLSKEELLEDENIVNILGYNLKEISLDEVVKSRGYSLLSSINKITKKDVELITGELTDVQMILLATPEKFSNIKGISKFKADNIYKALKRLKNKATLDRDYI